MNNDYVNGGYKKYGWEEQKSDEHFARTGRRIADECGPAASTAARPIERLRLTS